MLFVATARCLLLTMFYFFFFNDTATTEIYTLSLHDALPIFDAWPVRRRQHAGEQPRLEEPRSEEHTSELQSLAYLVCRLLLEKKKKVRPQLTDLPHEHQIQAPASRHAGTATPQNCCQCMVYA